MWPWGTHGRYVLVIVSYLMFLVGKSRNTLGWEESLDRSTLLQGFPGNTRNGLNPCHVNNLISFPRSVRFWISS